MIQDVFRAEGLPLDLAYVPLIESAFKPERAVARQGAGASGSSWRPPRAENGLKHDWYIDERSDPEKATLAAAKYLQTLVARCSTATGTWRSRRTTAARDGAARDEALAAWTTSGRSPTAAASCRARPASTSR